jgi:hypothetical protein
MHLEIDYNCGLEQYFWNICDGPDGIDTHEGIAASLGEVFYQVSKWRALNAVGYYNDDVN